MSYKEKKIVVVMPAYNAEKTLESCFAALPKEIIDEVVLVDDASKDRTVAIASRMPLTLKVHEENRGYGGNQKTCYRTALASGADVIVMVHPDHQYDPKFIPEMVSLIVDQNYQAVFGTRMMVAGDALHGGMPLWKYWGNIFLTKIGNICMGTHLTEFHSGFRAYHRKVFEKIDIEKNSNDFVFDTQIIIQLASRGIGIKEIPISTRYFADASQIGLMPSIKYGCEILYNLFLYLTGLRKF